MIIEIRPLNAGDVAEAERIFRLAFGTFLDLPDPITFMDDADLVTPRWRAAPEATLGAFHDNELVGSNLISRRGSFASFGPLTVLPQLWGNGSAKQLMAGTMDLFDQWRTQHIALFTFPHSPLHLALYQKFGFWPHYLTVVLAHTPEPDPSAPPWTLWSTLPETERSTWVTPCSSTKATD